MTNVQHYVADVKFDASKIDAVNTESTSLSTWQMAWRSLRRNPVFWFSAVVIVFIAFALALPWLFTSADPKYGNLSQAFDGPTAGHPLGFDSQGYDMVARLVYGAQPSISIGVLVTLISTLIGCLMGSIAGFFGGFFDTILSRITDIFYAVPMLLGAIVILEAFRDVEGIWKLVFVLSIFGWVSSARMVRGKVMETKNLEFVQSAVSLGASRLSILFKHIIPNSIAPVVVTATVGLGGAIVAESSLTFLGLGIGGSAPSWGHDISFAKDFLQNYPQLLIYPSVCLAITVLAFILLGDAISEALDPKERK